MPVAKKAIYEENMGPPVYVRLPLKLDEEIRMIAALEHTEISKIIRRFIDAGREALVNSESRPRVRRIV